MLGGWGFLPSEADLPLDSGRLHKAGRTVAAQGLAGTGRSLPSNAGGAPAVSATAVWSLLNISPLSPISRSS